MNRENHNTHTDDHSPKSKHLSFGFKIIFPQVRGLTEAVTPDMCRGVTLIENEVRSAPKMRVRVYSRPLYSSKSLFALQLESIASFQFCQCYR